MESKTGDGTTDSWFSGHTSTTSTASFFMAKVLSDYHPELGGKKWLLYGAAIIPPAIIGIYRVKALKHFPTDVIMGTAVGAAVGILIPHLHKITKKNKDLSIAPFAGQYSGLAMSLKF
jgi:membrane-associated phospholipid phosphatase